MHTGSFQGDSTLTNSVLAEQNVIEMASVGEVGEPVLLGENLQRLDLVLQVHMGIHPDLHDIRIVGIGDVVDSTEPQVWYLPQCPEW